MTIEEREQLVEAVAVRVLELLEDRLGAVGGQLVDASTLADLLGVSRDYVYSHAAELGAIKLSAGDRARLRFDPAVASRGLTVSKTTEESVPRQPSPQRRKARRKPASSVATARLLPLRGGGSGNE